MDLEHVLRDVVARVDPVPPEVSAYALSAYAFRGLDSEIAELEWDSWVDDARLTRRAGDARMLSFGSAGLELHVGVTRGERGYELTGRIEPPAPVEVLIRYRGGEVRRRADEHGQFDADIPAVSSIRFEWGGPVSPVVTGWVPIG